MLKSSVIGVRMETTMSSRLTQSSTSTSSENTDQRFRADGKKHITRTLHIVFFLWLVVSVALILTTISQRRAIIELLRTASAASTPATLTFPAQPWNPWTYGAQSLASDLPSPIYAGKRHVEDFCHRSSHRTPVGS